MSNADMKKDPKASGLKLSIEAQASQRDAETPSGGQADASATDDAALSEAVGFVKGFGIIIWKYAQFHPYTVLYGFIGLVLAILILVLGLWNTIVIAVFAGVGAVLGQIRDGDNGIVNFFGKLFDRR